MEAIRIRPQRRVTVTVVLIAAAMLAVGPGAVQAAPGLTHGGHEDATVTDTGMTTPTAAHAEGSDVQVAPGAGEGFLVQSLAPAAAPTTITFGPDPTPDPTGASQDLYIATLTGEVQRLDLLWTPVGPAVTDQVTVASGFNQPLGLAFGDDGTLYVSDSHSDPVASHPLGVVYAIDTATGDREVVVDGLPNGQHNVNHLRFGPDGLLYLPNGNPNDHGNGTGTGHADVFPYTGAFLAVDVDGVDPALPDTTSTDPALLHWEDTAGDEIAAEDLVDHPRNAEFAEQVDVYAYGFRNIFGIAFAPEDLPYAGTAYTGMNGADSPAMQDNVYKISEGEHHGYPFCYDVGQAGATGDAIEKVQAPDTPDASFPCEGRTTPTALLGWHICATGVDFPTKAQAGYPDAAFPTSMHGDLFVGECGPFQGQSVIDHTLANPTTHNTGHKVTQVLLDDAGDATGLEDFLTGLALPTDVRFGPDGAMYVADAGQILRVAGTPAAQAIDTADALVPGPVTEQTGPAPVAAVGQSFLPQITVVPVGEPVEWTRGAIPHTVTTSETLCPAEDCDDRANDPGEESDGDPDTFEVTLSSALGSHQHAFEDPGVYPYFCKFHDALGMVGTVVVVDPGDPTAVGPQDLLDALPSA